MGSEKVREFAFGPGKFCKQANSNGNVVIDPLKRPHILDVLEQKLFLIVGSCGSDFKLSRGGARVESGVSVRGYLSIYLYFLKTKRSKVF